MVALMPRLPAIVMATAGRTRRRGKARTRRLPRARPGAAAVAGSVGGRRRRRCRRGRRAGRPATSRPGSGSRGGRRRRERPARSRGCREYNARQPGGDLRPGIAGCGERHRFDPRRRRPPCAFGRVLRPAQRGDPVARSPSGAAARSGHRGFRGGTPARRGDRPYHGGVRALGRPRAAGGTSPLSAPRTSAPAGCCRARRLVGCPVGVAAAAPFAGTGAGTAGRMASGGGWRTSSRMCWPKSPSVLSLMSGVGLRWNAGPRGTRTRSIPSSI